MFRLDTIGDTHFVNSASVKERAILRLVSIDKFELLAVI